VIPPLDEAGAKLLVNSFERMKGCPKREGGLKPLIDAMLTAPNIRAAENFVNRWCREEKECPYPKDIYDAFKSFRPVNDVPEDTGCTLCFGTGWRIVTSPRVDSHGTHYTGAKRCICRPVKVG
jgi:hypothetical protein